MEFYTEKHPVARVEHKCHICSNIIKVGEKYSRESAKFEGQFFDRCTCSMCYGIRQEEHSENDSEFYDFYSLLDYVDCSFCKRCEDDTSCKGIFSCNKIEDYFSNKALATWDKIDKK